MLQSLNQNLKKPTQSLLKLSGVAKWNFRKGGPQEDIEITYSYDDNNMMHCSFKDVETGKLLEVEINASENATEKSDEIEKFLVD